MAVNDGDRVSTAKLLETLKGLQASRHLGSEPEVDPQTNEKTKHTIKQDYLPNADWSVNDPDADGYVEGRTHWVERTVSDIPVTTEQGMSAIPEMVKPEGFKFSTTTWKPDYEAIEFEGTESGMTWTGYLLAEDENGNQITDASSIFGGETFYTGVAIVDYSVYEPGLYLVVSCRYDNQDARADYILGVTEVVHKLDRKFYDYTPPADLNGYLETRNVYQVTSDSDYCYFLNKNVITNLDDNKKSINGYTFEPVDTKINLYADDSDNPFFYLRQGFGNRIWYLYPITHDNGVVSSVVRKNIPYIGIGKKIIITPDLQKQDTYAPDPSQYYDMFIPNIGYYWNYHNRNGSTNVTEFAYGNNTVSIIDENNHLIDDIFGVNMPSEVRNYYKSDTSDDISALNRPLRLGAISNSQSIDYTSKNPYLSNNENTKYTTSLNGVTLHGTITIEKAPTSGITRLCDKKRIKSFEYDITSDINLSSDAFTTVENVFGIDLTTFDVVLPDGRYGKFSKTTMTLNDNTSVNRLPTGSLIYKHGRFDIG